MFDNWSNAPGALVITDDGEATREQKLLAWAADFASLHTQLSAAKRELARVSAGKVSVVIATAQ